MAGELVIEVMKDGESQDVSRVSSGSVSLGREPENRIVIDSDNVSRRHASILEAGSAWVYVDLNSSNGSWVNGVQVHAEQYRLLRDGDELYVADCALKIKISQSDDSSADDEPSLVIFEDGKWVCEFPVSDAEFVLGGADGDFVPDGLSDKEILRIEKKGDSLELITGGEPVVVNRFAVSGVTKLVDRDEVSFGSVLILVKDIASAVSRPKRAGNDAESSNVYDRANVPAHMKGSVEGGWESEASKRKMDAEKTFVFSGSSSEGLERTQQLPTVKSRSGGGFEVSASQRFAIAGLEKELKAPQPQWYQHLLVGLGALVFFGIIIGLGYVLFF